MVGYVIVSELNKRFKMTAKKGIRGCFVLSLNPNVVVNNLEERLYTNSPRQVSPTNKFF